MQEWVVAFYMPPHGIAQPPAMPQLFGTQLALSNLSSGEAEQHGWPPNLCPPASLLRNACPLPRDTWWSVLEGAGSGDAHASGKDAGMDD